MILSTVETWKGQLRFLACDWLCTNAPMNDTPPTWGGWGIGGGKHGVPMVGGGGNMGEVHPRSAPPVAQSTPRFGQIPTPHHGDDYLLCIYLCTGVKWLLENY